MTHRSLFVVLMLVFALSGFAQKIYLGNPSDLLKSRGEINLKIDLTSKGDLFFLSKMVSIDKTVGLSVWATANSQGFEKLQQTQLAYQVFSPDSLGRRLKGSFGDYSAYPTFTEYINLLLNFAKTYPSICRLDTIGYSINGRLIPVVKISKNVNKHEAKPQFFYTSTIHGDETGGFVLMLRLIDYLLSNYGKDAYSTALVDQLEIWINPLSNPDGTYDSKGTISSPVRYNANYFDLNRNFPDPQDGAHPDGYVYQKENIAMMSFLSKHQFTLSANFHAGSELLNYPWDTWGIGNSSYQDHPNHCDQDWFIHICKQYADSVFRHTSNPTYFKKDTVSGFIDGYKWYRITGGRQDYETYFLHGREVTIELDQTKLTSDLRTLWDENYISLLGYMKQATYGFSGLVSDSVTNMPLKAKVFVVNHDVDSAWIYSDASTGFYQRPIIKGTYSLLFSAPGYLSKQINNLAIDNESHFDLSVKLQPISTGTVSVDASDIFSLVNPVVNDQLVIISKLEDPNKHYQLEILNGLGQPVYQYSTLAFGNTMNRIDLPNLQAGVYFCRLSAQGVKPLCLKFIKL